MLEQKKRELNIIPVFSAGEIEGALMSARELLNKNAKDVRLASGEYPFWYRGCARETYTLVPSLFRFDNGLGVERKLYEDFAREKALLEMESHWRALFEMQHFRIPTRLLDWTEDPEVAKYFALSPDDSINPSIFVLHTGILNRLALGMERPPFRLALSDEFKYPDYYCGALPGKDLPVLPIAVEPDVGQLAQGRIRAQSGKFTLHWAKSFPADPMETVCPDAVAKLVVRGRVSDRERKPYRRKANQYFPDDTGLAITIVENNDLARFAQKRITEAVISLWDTPVAGIRLNPTYIEREAKREEFLGWLRCASSRFCIVKGGAGSGKTNFLIKSVLKDDHHKFPVMYLSLNVLRVSQRGLILCIADALKARCADKPIDAAVLESMIRKGEIVLILDGLDELARNQGLANIEKLRIELDQLAEYGFPRVVIACRDHIFHWLSEHGIVFPANTVEISLLPIPDSEIEERLRKAGCPINILNSTALLKKAGEMPLLYDVIMTAIENRRVLEIDEVHDEAGCWWAWLAMASRAPGVPDVAGLPEKLGLIATRMLQKRGDFITEAELRRAAEEGAGDLLSLARRLADKDCRVFVEEAGAHPRIDTSSEDGNRRWRFVHQAMREYVLAWNINYGLQHPGEEPSSIKETPSFDYESAETYVFLEKLLSKWDLVVNGVGSNFEGVSGNDTQWNNFVRNYFEAVGMIGASGQVLEKVVSQALRVLARRIERPNIKVRYRTRFNAARCLARLHATAPRVYCVNVTSTDRWKGNHDGQLVYGYAVRGFNRSIHEISPWPPELLLKPDDNRQLDAELERRVSQTLMDVISKPSEEEELHPEANFLQVNCSHALIRWLAAEDFRTAKKLALSEALALETRGNLVLALARKGEDIPGIEMPREERGGKGGGSAAPGRAIPGVEMPREERGEYKIGDLKALFRVRSNVANTGS